MFERLGEVKKRLDRLELKIKIGGLATVPPGAQPVREVSPAPVEKTMSSSQASVSEQVTPNLPTPAPEFLHCVPARPSLLNERWRRIEHTFIENWTGILGTVVVVAGVTFIGIYTALRLEPFYRFLMMVSAAAALVGTSVFLYRREAWQALSQWLRSAGAASWSSANAQQWGGSSTQGSGGA